jgi:hypothetical protein
VFCVFGFCCLLFADAPPAPATSEAAHRAPRTGAGGGGGATMQGNTDHEGPRGASAPLVLFF